MSARENIEAYILHLLAERHIRLQPLRLIKKAEEVFPDFSRNQIRTTIKTLVAKGALAYTNIFSTTYLVQNRKAVLRVKRSLGRNSEISLLGHHSQIIPIHLSDGLAFGYGNHPTTQLCLRGMETVMQSIRKTDPGSRVTVLDIGTGSGVLAIAAALLGAQRVIALDIDPLACREARINAELNHVSHEISILAGDITALRPQSFDLLVANLRGPTLKGLSGQIATRINDGGKAVFSGFRWKEKKVIADQFRIPRWKKIWDSESRGWAAVVLERQVFV